MLQYPGGEAATDTVFSFFDLVETFASLQADCSGEAVHGHATPVDDLFEPAPAGFLVLFVIGRLHGNWG